MSSSASAKRDELELRRGRERLGDVAAVEGSAKTHVGRALSGHERMFPCLSTLRKNRSLGLHAFAHAYYGGRPERRRGSISLRESRRSRNRPSRASSAQPFVSQCGAEPPLSPIALPTSRVVDSPSFDQDAWDSLAPHRVRNAKGQR